MTMTGQEIVLKQPVRFLALGDSYTIGQSVDETDRWPNQLADLLKDSGIEIETLKIIARTGWRTDNLQAAIEAENPGSDYNLVSLLIGVNNQFQGTNFDIYPIEFRELLNQAIELCGGNKTGVFVLSIPDYGYTPFGSSNKATISAEIDRYNATNKSITKEMGVTYVDITPISREAESKPWYLASDNLHPSGVMYAQWVGEIINYMDYNTPSSINDNPTRRRVTLYPNPASNRVTCNSENPISSFTLYNLLGARVLSKKCSGEDQIEINLSGLESGIYYYKVTMLDDGIESGKLVVH